MKKCTVSNRWELMFCLHRLNICVYHDFFIKLTDNENAQEETGILKEKKWIMLFSVNIGTNDQDNSVQKTISDK